MIVCDVCGENVRSTVEYVLPKEEIDYIKNKYGQNIAMNWKMYKPKYKSLCPKCEELLSQFVEYYMPAISKNNEFELAIVKKDEVEM